MKYVLGKEAIGDEPAIEISKGYYESCKRSKTILSACLAIEENYEILVSNYFEWEKQILDTTVMSMLREHVGYSDFLEVQLALNIRLVNLLTSARLYVDQLRQHITECHPHRRTSEEFIKSILAREYDENPAYRFMEELRNYVQHRGLPVHWTSFNMSWTSLGEHGLLEYSMDLAVKKVLLKEDKKFKKKVIEEASEKVDLKLASRSYIESLSKVHHAVREQIQDSVQKARLTLEGAHNEYSKIYSGSLLGLCICITNGSRVVEMIPLLLDWDDVRVELQKRTQRLVNLRKRYATGKANSL
jgi:hypothetical protein